MPKRKAVQNVRAVAGEGELAVVHRQLAHAQEMIRGLEEQLREAHGNHADALKTIASLSEERDKLAAAGTLERWQEDAQMIGRLLDLCPTCVGLVTEELARRKYTTFASLVRGQIFKLLGWWRHAEGCPKPAPVQESTEVTATP